MARAFWKGVISFGLVAIPVKMYVATESRAISFHVLHKKCMNRLKQTWYCPVDNEYTTLQDSVKGYEYGPDQYIVLNEKDFEKVPVKTLHAINIAAFVNAAEIDPIYFHGSHYIEPDELGVKPFNLLREALMKTGRLGIAKVTFQKQEHLCCLRPLDDILVLHTMYFHDEILPRENIAAQKQEISGSELEMAVTLISTMTKNFKPADYKDEYHSALKKLVEAKVQGQEIKAPKETRVAVKDLMEALRTSIETARKQTVAAGRVK
jgi:DNA end-binding protein Ku